MARAVEVGVQFWALMLSLAIEVPVVCVLVWVSGWAARRREVRAREESGALVTASGLEGRSARGALGLRVAIAAACGTLLTHPVVWWANTKGLAGVMSGATRLAALELGAVCVEGALLVWLIPLRWWRGLGVSLLANGASFGLGWVLIRVWLFWR